MRTEPPPERLDVHAPSLVPVPPWEIGRAAELLARTFADDPMMRYLVADQQRMLDRPMPLYRASIRMGHRYGVVETTPSFEGLAVWVRPGSTDFSVGQMLRTGMATAAVRMGLTSMTRFLRSYGPVEKAKKSAISEPHWYLMFLGVEPSLQGRGLGAVLIRPGLLRADADGVPCYLDSTNVRNLTFYERHGFLVVAEGVIPGGPRFWGMRRDPAPERGIRP